MLFLVARYSDTGLIWRLLVVSLTRIQPEAKWTDPRQKNPACVDFANVGTTRGDQPCGSLSSKPIPGKEIIVYYGYLRRQLQGVRLQ